MLPLRVIDGFRLTRISKRSQSIDYGVTVMVLGSRHTYPSHSAELIGFA